MAVDLMMGRAPADISGYPMGVVPFAPEPETTADADRSTSDPQHQALLLKRKLEEAVGDVTRLQTGLTAYEELQRLLKHGRTLLQEMRTRLEQVSGERDRLDAELGLAKAQLQQTTAERDALEAKRYDLARQLEEATASQREMAEDLDEQRQQIQSLREAATRAQTLAREIMKAHEGDRLQSS